MHRKRGDAGPVIHTASFDAIGVRNQVTVTGAAALETVHAIAVRELARLDEAASRFRDDSELSLLNRHGAAVVSPLLYELIEVALRAARWTDGLVDPTIGRSLRAAGYDRDFDMVVRRGDAPRVELVPATGWASVRLDPVTRRVSLRPGTELDLGATAKARAADRIAAAAAAETGAGVLVSLGGDVAVAGDEPRGGWPIGLAEDSRGEARGPTVAVHEGGLATSSTTVRRWTSGGAELHHLLQPATGAPATEVWRTAAVTARTCLVANAAATAAILHGAAAPAWLRAKRLPARLVAADGAEVCLAGWPVTANSQEAAAP
jgi:thiamine biosynthesis lipoprotein